MAILKSKVQFGLPIVNQFGLPILKDKPVPFKPVSKVTLPIVKPQPVKFGLPIIGSTTFKPMKRK